MKSIIFGALVLVSQTSCVEQSSHANYEYFALQGSQSAIKQSIDDIRERGVSSNNTVNYNISVGCTRFKSLENNVNFFQFSGEFTYSKDEHLSEILGEEFIPDPTIYIFHCDFIEKTCDGVSISKKEGLISQVTPLTNIKARDYSDKIVIQWGIANTFILTEDGAFYIPTLRPRGAHGKSTVKCDL